MKAPQLVINRFEHNLAGRVARGSKTTAAVLAMYRRKILHEFEQLAEKYEANGAEEIDQDVVAFDLQNVIRRVKEGL